MAQKAPLEALHPEPGAAALLESLRPRRQGAPPAATLDVPGGEHLDLHLPPPTEARLSPPGSPRSPHSPRAAVAARRPADPSPLAQPSLFERVLGTELHTDPTEKAGHPGVPCSELPPGHAHRCVGCRAALAGVGWQLGMIRCCQLWQLTDTTHLTRLQAARLQADAGRGNAVSAGGCGALPSNAAAADRHAGAQRWSRCKQSNEWRQIGSACEISGQGREYEVGALGTGWRQCPRHAAAYCRPPPSSSAAARKA